MRKIECKERKCKARFYPLPKNKKYCSDACRKKDAYRRKAKNG